MRAKWIYLCITLSLITVGSVAVMGSKVFLTAETTDPEIFAKDAVPYGKTYPEWASAWWQWHISIPSNIHPRENYTSERCSLMQAGPVWFLADGPNRSPVERTCTVPFGKAVLVQVSGGECDYGETGLNTDQKVIECVDGPNEGAVAQAWIDGKQVTGFQDMLAGHNWFNITIPENNVYDEKPGTYRALSDGWFLFVKPLPLGKHDIRIKGDVTRIGPDGVPTDEDHHVDVTYHLDIK